MDEHGDGEVMGDSGGPAVETLIRSLIVSSLVDCEKARRHAESYRESWLIDCC